MTVTGTTFIFDRNQAVRLLTERDGFVCQFPGCDLPFDNGRHELTIDHKYPQSRARSEGWTYEQIWHIDNLLLMGKTCNAKKGALVFNEDGSLDLPANRTHSDKSHRVPVCETCMSGRLLLFNEVCGVCGSGPQPAVAPKYLQRLPKECDHSRFHCWRCWLGDIPRRPAIDVILTGP